MSQECESCSSQRIIPVIDKRIERSPTAGNKYREFCENCGRFLEFTSSEMFEQADKSMVLPSDADPQNPDALMSVGQWEREKEPEAKAEQQDERLEDLKERVTDGGADQPETESEPDTDPANEFECPECLAPNEGYPDECPECGIGYDWSNIN